MPFVKRPRLNPVMMVPKDLTIKRQQNFIDYGKYDILNSIVRNEGGEGERKSFSCNLEKLFDLFLKFCSEQDACFIRIYIASYDQSADKHLIGKLTLVFCACKSEEEDIKAYYYYDEKNNEFVLNNTKANDWVSFYQKKKLLSLASTLKPYDPNNDGDTKSYFYKKDAIVDLLSEIFYQIGRKNRQAFGLNIHFGAYDIQETSYKKQLSMGFTFAKESGEDIYIEDMNDAKETTSESTIKEKLAAWEVKLSFLSGQLDTGTPCPPNKNCPTSGNGLPQ